MALTTVNPAMIGQTSTGASSLTATGSGAASLVTAAGTVLTATSAGRVGIGTTSPAYGLDYRNNGALSFGSTGYAFATFTDVAQNRGLYLGYDTASSYNAVIAPVSGPMEFYTYNGSAWGERLRIVDTGGTRFQCENFANTPSSTNQGVEINNTNAGSRFFGGGTGTETQIEFGNRNGTRGSIQTNSTNTLYNTTSDYRLKENVAPMTGALATVSLLKPCTYTWKVDGSDGQGFIAHELQEVVPDCVTGEKDAVDENGDIKPQCIDTSFLVATLTAAIQELNAKVTALEIQLAAKGA